MPSATTSPRKPKPKVRALKEHKPKMRVDLEQAELALKEVSTLSRKLFRAQDDFNNAIRWPIFHAAQVDGIDADVKTILESVRESLSDHHMRTSRQRDEMQNLMAVALAGLRILRANREKSEQEVAQ